MRSAFIQTLLEIAKSDSRVMLLTADLGFSVLELFAKQLPRQFINVGVAEQNMLGLATGLAKNGFIPFVYSITTFATLRPYEFIRNGPLLHAARVRILGIGTGFDYGTAGVTHHSLEDVGVLRIQPELNIFTPINDVQAQSALRATWNLPGVLYYRLSKRSFAPLAGFDSRFEVGRAHMVAEDADVLLIAMGEMVTETCHAAQLLEKKGVRAGVMAVSCVAPAPLIDMVPALKRYATVLTVESHYRTGGLGSMVSEIIAENGLICRLTRCGVAEAMDGITGSTEFLNARHGLTAPQIADAALKARASAVSH